MPGAPGSASWPRRWSRTPSCAICRCSRSPRRASAIASGPRNPGYRGPKSSRSGTASPTAISPSTSTSSGRSAPGPPRTRRRRAPHALPGATRMKGPARVPALAGYGGRSPAAAISGNPSQSKLRSPNPHRLGISVATGSGPAVRQARTRTPALHVACRNRVNVGQPTPSTRTASSRRATLSSGESLAPCPALPGMRRDPESADTRVSHCRETHAAGASDNRRTR